MNALVFLRRARPYLNRLGQSSEERWVKYIHRKGPNIQKHISMSLDKDKPLEV